MFFSNYGSGLGPNIFLADSPSMESAKRNPTSRGELASQKNFQCFSFWAPPTDLLLRAKTFVKCSGAKAVSYESFREYSETLVAVSFPLPATAVVSRWPLASRLLQ